MYAYYIIKAGSIILKQCDYSNNNTVLATLESGIFIFNISQNQ